MLYYYELVDADILSIIIENYDRISIDWTKSNKKRDEQLDLLVKYHKKIVSNQVKVCYGASPKQPRGREYVEKGLGLQKMKKEIRQTIQNGKYRDYDAKHALPSVLSWYAKKNGQTCVALDTILGDYTMYKKHKEIILESIFGGSQKYNQLTKKIKIIEDLRKEIKTIQTFMAGENIGKPNIKKENYNGSLCAIILQEYERQILDCCEDFLIFNKIPIINLIKAFDGFELPSTITLDLEALNKWVFEKTTIPMQFVEKQKEYVLDLTGFETSENALKNEYNEIKKEFEMEVAMIKDPAHFIINRDYGFQRIPKNDLFTLYAHLTIGKKRNSFITEWLKDANKRCYDKIDFLPPPLHCPSNVYNLWRGFDIEKVKLYEYTDDDLKPFFDLVNVMANNDPKTFDYLIKWNADILQNAGRKTGTAVVLKGAQGTGKNTYAKIQKKLFSQEYYVDTADPKKDIFGDYNNLTTNKLLINFNETESKDTFANNSRIKDMITEPTENVREKYVKAIVIKSFCRLQFLSNNYIVVKLEDGDRRFVILEVSDEKKGDTDYWDRINNWLDNDFNIRKLYDYLMKIDISTFKWEKERPITQAYLETMDSCKANELKFLDELLHDWKTGTTELKITNKFIQDKMKSMFSLSYEYNMKSFNGVVKKLNIPMNAYKSNLTRGWAINHDELLKFMIEKKYHTPEKYETCQIINESEYETDF